MKTLKMLKERKGFSLYLSVFLVILVSIIILSLWTLFDQYVLLAMRTQRAAEQNYFYADLGIYRGRWLIDYGGVVETGHSETICINPDTYTFVITEDGTPDDTDIEVEVEIEYDDNRADPYVDMPYKIKSKVKSAAGGQVKKMITAYYTGMHMRAWE